MLQADDTAERQSAPISDEAAAAPLAGKIVYYAFPLRRRTILANLSRALPEYPSKIMAQRFYGHICRSIGEMLRFSLVRQEDRFRSARVDNLEAIMAASRLGRGVLVLTGHLGNWEVASLAGLANLPEYKGRFHTVRRPINPPILDRMITARSRRAGINVLSKRGSLDRIIELLQVNDAVIFVMDQHAGGRDGVQADFFGHPAWTFKSLAVIALSTGAPVVPASTFREAPGRHVLRFEPALTTIEDEDTDRAILANTRLYNQTLERLIRRHPEQWIWMHRRWKPR